MSNTCVSCGGSGQDDKGGVCKTCGGTGRYCFNPKNEIERGTGRLNLNLSLTINLI